MSERDKSESRKDVRPMTTCETDIFFRILIMILFFFLNLLPTRTLNMKRNTRRTENNKKAKGEVSGWEELGR